MRELDRSALCETLCFVLMPDHIHWLFALTGHRSLSQVVAAMKSITAHKFGEPLWQAGFYDRAIRQSEDLPAVARYIVANPLRAGLVSRLGDYPHWDAIWV